MATKDGLMKFMFCGSSREFLDPQLNTYKRILTFVHTFSFDKSFSLIYF